MDVITKSATVTPVESENPNGEFEVILSTETLDRDSENLWADEWKQPLPDRIHIDGDHGRSLDKTVGSAVPRLEGNKLIGKGTYAGTPYAQMVRQLVNEGHVNSVSVTYAENKSQKDGKPQRELLNAAFVPIPANPEAIVLASKAAKLVPKLVLPPNEARALYNLDDKADGADSAGTEDAPKHDDMVQAIHDAAAHLGAQCMSAAEADPGTDEGANKGVSVSITMVGPRALTAHVGSTSKTFTNEQLDDGTVLKWITETSSLKDAGIPQESAEESAAAEPAEKSAGSTAADESADNAAAKKRLALSARSLEFLISKNLGDSDAQ